MPPPPPPPSPCAAAPSLSRPRQAPGTPRAGMHLPGLRRRFHCHRWPDWASDTSSSAPSLPNRRRPHLWPRPTPTSPASSPSSLEACPEPRDAVAEEILTPFLQSRSSQPRGRSHVHRALKVFGTLLDETPLPHWRQRTHEHI